MITRVNFPTFAMADLRYGRLIRPSFAAANHVVTLTRVTNERIVYLD